MYEISIKFVVVESENDSAAGSVSDRRAFISALVVASGLIYRASDCNVSASARPGNAGEAMVFPYIGWTIDISVTTLNGEEWPYYE